MSHLALSNFLICMFILLHIEFKCLHWTNLPFLSLLTIRLICTKAVRGPSSIHTSRQLSRSALTLWPYKELSEQDSIECRISDLFGRLYLGYAYIAQYLGFVLFVNILRYFCTINVVRISLISIALSHSLVLFLFVVLFKSLL